MIKIKSKLIIANYSFNWFDGGDDIKMAYYQSTAPPSDLPKEYKSALLEISQKRNLLVRFCLVNVIPPGKVAKLHTDTLSTNERLERWHLPIQTNKDAFYWDRTNGFVNMELGFWHGPIEYWNKHTAGNFGESERVHLVVDLG